MNIRYALINGTYRFPKKKIEKKVEEKKEETEVENIRVYNNSDATIESSGFTTTVINNENTVTDAPSINFSYDDFSSPSSSITYNESQGLELRTDINFFKRLRNLIKMPFIYLIKGRIVL